MESLGKMGLSRRVRITGPSGIEGDEDVGGTMCRAGRVGAAALFALLMGIVGWFLDRTSTRPWAWSFFQALAATLALAAAGVPESWWWSPRFRSSAFRGLAGGAVGAIAGNLAYALLAPVVQFDHVIAAGVTAVAGDVAFVAALEDVALWSKAQRLFCCDARSRRSRRPDDDDDDDEIPNKEGAAKSSGGKPTADSESALLHGETESAKRRKELAADDS